MWDIKRKEISRQPRPVEINEIQPSLDPPKQCSKEISRKNVVIHLWVDTPRAEASHRVPLRAGDFERLL